jgi:hypothetical protein
MNIYLFAETFAIFYVDSHSIVGSLAVCIVEEHYFFAHSLGSLAWMLLDPFANYLSFIPLVTTLASYYTNIVCHVHTLSLLKSID